MEAIPNGEFSENTSEKSEIESKTTDFIETSSFNSVQKNNGDTLAEDVCQDNDPDVSSSLKDDSNNCNSTALKNINTSDIPEACELESSKSLETKKNVSEETDTNLAISNVPHKSVVDSLTLLNNSVQNIPALFDKPLASGSSDRTSSNPVLPFSSEANVHKISESVNDHKSSSSDPELLSDPSCACDSSLKIITNNLSCDKSFENSENQINESCSLTCTVPEEKCCNKVLEFSNTNSKPIDKNMTSSITNDFEKLEDGAQNFSMVASPSSCLDNKASKAETSKNNFQEKSKETDNFVFTEISNEETGFPEVFTGLVTIGKYISVKGDFTLRSSEALVESPSLVAPFLLKEPDSFPLRDVPLKNDSRGFFFSAAGELLIGLGLSRVSEWFHRDMIRIKKRQMKKEGKNPQLENELKIHEEFYSESKKANRSYSFPLNTCKTCGFSTESAIAMEGHLLVPHVNARKEFACNFCDSSNWDPRKILEHMFRVHAKTGRIQPPSVFFECPYCTFETNSKVKLGNHMTKCQRIYDPKRNQAPPKDFEFPALTPKPITVAVVKAYEKSLSTMQRGRGRPKKADGFNEQLNPFSSVSQLSSIPHNPVPNYRPNSSPILSEGLSNLTNQLLPHMQMPNISFRHPPAHPGINQFRHNLNPLHLPASNRLLQAHSSSQMMPMMGNNSFITSQSQFPFNPSLVSSGKKLPSHSPNIITSLFGTGMRQQQNAANSSNDITITPLPKLQGPYPVPHVRPSMPTSDASLPEKNMVVCEICDGFIKDLEQLRSHMQLIHKVKIHPKMLVSRPPLNCQKCQLRFFTDQGLERHLLGSHGLVTSNMQELANKSKDAGCCTICGRVYASKLVSHMNQVHKLTLKPAHLSYKCTVCCATFNLYRLFENHVYLVHSGAAKRSAESISEPTKRIRSGNVDGRRMSQF